MHTLRVQTCADAPGTRRAFSQGSEGWSTEETNMTKREEVRAARGYYLAMVRFLGESAPATQAALAEYDRVAAEWQRSS